MATMKFVTEEELYKYLKLNLKLSTHDDFKVFRKFLRKCPKTVFNKINIQLTTENCEIVNELVRDLRNSY